MQMEGTVDDKDTNQSICRRITKFIPKRTLRRNMIFSCLVISLELLDPQLDPRKLGSLS